MMAELDDGTLNVYIVRIFRLPIVIKFDKILLTPVWDVH